MSVSVSSEDFVLHVAFCHFVEVDAACARFPSGPGIFIELWSGG